MYADKDSGIKFASAEVAITIGNSHSSLSRFERKFRLIFTKFATFVDKTMNFFFIEFACYQLHDNRSLPCLPNIHQSIRVLRR